MPRPCARLASRPRHWPLVSPGKAAFSEIPSSERGRSALLSPSAQDGQLEVGELAHGGLLYDLELRGFALSRPLTKLARLVERAGLGALELPTRRLGEGSRRERH